MENRHENHPGCTLRIRGARRLQQRLHPEHEDRSDARIERKPYLNERTGMYEYRTKDGKDAWIRKEEVVEILER